MADGRSPILLKESAAYKVKPENCSKQCEKPADMVLWVLLAGKERKETQHKLALELFFINKVSPLREL